MIAWNVDSFRFPAPHQYVSRMTMQSDACAPMIKPRAT